VLYRVLCELITNTIKHAKAKNVYVDLLADEKSISLKYIDDGIGFNEKQVKEDLIGLGYSNIQSRIKSLNGTFMIYSEPGEGIQVDVHIKRN